MKREKGTFVNNIGNAWQILLKTISHNWQLKVTCFVLAVLLWGIIISQDENITRRKTFQDVDITVSSSSITSLRSSGLIITEGLDDLPKVTFEVSVPQKNYQSVTSGNYSLRLDLTGIRSAGEYDVPVIWSNSSSYGEVVYCSVGSVHVKVEGYASRSRIPVNVVYTGALPEGYWCETAKADPGVVAIAGPKEKIYQVASCKAEIDLSQVEAKVSTGYVAVPFKLYDSEGQEVDPTNITVMVSGQSTTIDSVIVQQNIYKLFTLPVTTEGLITGSPAEGYEVTGVTPSQTQITFALNSETCTETEIRLAGTIEVRATQKDNLVRVCSVVKPEGCMHIDHNTVSVTVAIAPVEESDP